MSELTDSQRLAEYMRRQTEATERIARDIKSVRAIVAALFLLVIVGIVIAVAASNGS